MFFSWLPPLWSRSENQYGILESQASSKPSQRRKNLAQAEVHGLFGDSHLGVPPAETTCLVFETDRTRIETLNRLRLFGRSAWRRLPLISVEAKLVHERRVKREVSRSKSTAAASRQSPRWATQ